MTAVPVRLQRRRTKGFHLESPNGLPVVYVGRPTIWGNPFKVGSKSPYGTVIADNRHAASIYAGFAPQNDKLIVEAQKLLKGKNLACFCKLCDLHKVGKPMNTQCPYCEPCHADVVLKLANQELAP